MAVVEAVAVGPRVAAAVGHRAVAAAEVAGHRVVEEGEDMAAAVAVTSSSSRLSVWAALAAEEVDMAVVAAAEVGPREAVEAAAGHPVAVEAAAAVAPPRSSRS